MQIFNALQLTVIALIAHSWLHFNTPYVSSSLLSNYADLFPDISQRQAFNRFFEHFRNTAQFKGYQSNTSKPNPLIVIPGDGGSQAFAQYKQGTPFLAWVNLYYLFFPSRLEPIIKLQYDPATHKVFDAPDYNITFPGWGDTLTIEELDTRHYARTSYFSPFIRAVLAANSFFRRNQTVRGTPYDFRRAPSENAVFFSRFQRIIEQTYANAGGRRVVLVAHSLGNIYTLVFLHNMRDAWKRKYVQTYVSVSAPLGGAVKAMKDIISGENFGVVFRSSLSYLNAIQTHPSLVQLRPHPYAFDNATSCITTPNRHYSVRDYERLLNDTGNTLGEKFHRDIWGDTLLPHPPLHHRWQNQSHPHHPRHTQFWQLHYDPRTHRPTGIDQLFCFYGLNVSTPRMYHYTQDFSVAPRQVPSQVITADGDGTVNAESLRLCDAWPGVNVRRLGGVGHLEIVSNPEFIRIMLAEVLFQPNNYGNRHARHTKKKPKREENQKKQRLHN